MVSSQKNLYFSLQRLQAKDEILQKAAHPVVSQEENLSILIHGI